MTTPPPTPGLADRYEREVLPRLVERLDTAFPEFVFVRDRDGWIATNDESTHRLLGCRADRVICHGEAPRGILIHGQGPVLFTTLANGMRPARGRDFVDTVRALAQRVGIELDPAAPPTPAARRSAILHDTLVLSRRELRSDHGTEARDYLFRGRRFPATALETEAIGVIPTADRLSRGLLAAGHTPATIDASNVLADDRWPGRLVGAWRDTHGHARTLWTRSTDPAEPATTRYLYLRGAPRTSLPPYGLGDLLAGERDARRHVVLVEGVLDHHHLHARGIPTTAALGGTATRPDLFTALDLFGVEEVTLMLDADHAGHDATCRAIDNAVRAERCPDLTVVRIDPDFGNDPDAYARNGHLEELRAHLETRPGAITWRALGLATEGATRGRQAGEWLGALGPRWAIEQDGAIGAVADHLNVDPKSARRAFRARYWPRLPEEAALERVEAR